jgi:hypothetical protein
MNIPINIEVEPDIEIRCICGAYLEIRDQRHYRNGVTLFVTSCTKCRNTGYDEGYDEGFKHGSEDE